MERNVKSGNCRDGPKERSRGHCPGEIPHQQQGRGGWRDEHRDYQHHPHGLQRNDYNDRQQAQEHVVQQPGGQADDRRARWVETHEHQLFVQRPYHGQNDGRQTEGDEYVGLRRPQHLAQKNVFEVHRQSLGHG